MGQVRFLLLRDSWESMDRREEGKDGMDGWVDRQLGGRVDGWMDGATK